VERLLAVLAAFRTEISRLEPMQFRRPDCRTRPGPALASGGQRMPTPRGFGDAIPYEKNPVYRVCYGRETLRRRLDLPDDELDFEVLIELRERGVVASPANRRSHAACFL